MPPTIATMKIERDAPHVKSTSGREKESSFKIYHLAQKVLILLLYNV